MFWEGGCLKFRDTYIQVTKLSWRACIGGTFDLNRTLPNASTYLTPTTQILISLLMSDFLLDEETIFKEFFVRLKKSPRNVDLHLRNVVPFFLSWDLLKIHLQLSILSCCVWFMIFNFSGEGRGGVSIK